MAFTDVIDDYSNGATGTLNTTDGGSVGYTVTSDATTITRPNTDQGAQIFGNGTRSVEVEFDDPVVGLTLSFDRSNSGETYLVEIDGVVVDLNTAIANGDVIFTTTIAGSDPAVNGTHVITASGGMTNSDSSPTNGSLGILHFVSPVTTVKLMGDGNSGGWDLVEIGIDSESFTVFCFAKGTDIQTPAGQAKIETLMAGDTVVTQEGAHRKIAQIQSRRITPLQQLRETRLRPVRIAKGALGAGLPHAELRVSRQHRILVASRIAARLTGHAQVLIPAIKLTELPGITVDHASGGVDYYHIQLADHDVVMANGAPAETLLIGPMAALGLGQETPETQVIDGAGLPAPQMTPAFPIPHAKLCKKIVAAHLKHARPMLEEWQTETA